MKKLQKIITAQNLNLEEIKNDITNSNIKMIFAMMFDESYIGCLELNLDNLQNLMTDKSKEYLHYINKELSLVFSEIHYVVKQD